MIKELLTCCNELMNNGSDPYERRPREPYANGRTSRFLEVTSNPLNQTVEKISLNSKFTNKTLNANNLTRFDTRASDNPHKQYQNRGNLIKPTTPILGLAGLMESRVERISQPWSRAPRY